MAKYVLCVFLFFTFFSSGAQKDSIRKYLDGDLHFTTKKNFVYTAMAVRTGDHWVLHGVYPDTAVLLKVYFKDAGLSIKDGPFLLYHPKRIPAQEGYFKNNIPYGRWRSWYSNGQLKNEGSIVNNHFSGVWKYWYDNGQPMMEHSYSVYRDSANGQAIHESTPAYGEEKLMDDFEPEGILEGVSTTWYKNGSKESVLNYRNDSLSGLCTWFRENGSASSKEIYAGGKVTELECYDEEGKYTGATCSILKLPVLVHPFFTALDYIEYELHKEKNKDIKDEGDVEISFTVTKKGTAENLVIISSPDEALSKHIVQIFARMPAWSPAVTHNRMVDYAMKLKVPYYRE